MTVNELIEELKQMSQDGFGESEVHFAYDYGDYWHTKVAPKVSNVETEKIEHSEYHRMPKLMLDEDGESDGTEVVVLS